MPVDTGLLPALGVPVKQCLIGTATTSTGSQRSRSSQPGNPLLRTKRGGRTVAVRKRQPIQEALKGWYVVSLMMICGSPLGHLGLLNYKAVVRVNNLAIRR